MPPPTTIIIIINIIINVLLDYKGNNNNVLYMHARDGQKSISEVEILIIHRIIVSASVSRLMTPPFHPPPPPPPAKTCAFPLSQRQQGPSGSLTHRLTRVSGR